MIDEISGIENLVEAVRNVLKVFIKGLDVQHNLI